MQRIDENTYIDDTLVTCAEYQLFIDEMREQGKYHQPDHWSSYQFPKGQARYPILGIRYSDAVSFCEWLTLKNLDSWNYRLPTDVEAEGSQLKTKNPLPLGYWVADTNHKFHFLNINNIPSDIRALDLKKVLVYADNIDINSILDKVFKQSNKFTRTLKQRFIHVNNFKDVINSACNLPVDLDFDRAQTLVSNLDNVPRFVYLLALENALRLRINFYANENEFKDVFYKIFIDLYTLQERIAGRSPAFEGIRLVKERIK